MEFLYCSPLFVHFRLSAIDRDALTALLRLCFALSPFPKSTLPVTKLYVGNLPFTATDDSVRALFSKHGTVEKISLVTDRDTGRPRGFGFVEMSNADASRAMQALNGTEFDGRTLKVNEAQDRERSGGGNRGGGSRRY